MKTAISGEMAGTRTREEGLKPVATVHTLFSHN
jgi:hypothetical protein